MMKFRSFLALGLGKSVQILTQKLNLGGGTNLPGTLARLVDPNLLSTLTATLPQGVILLTGTNGKTTTTRMLANLLRSNGSQVLHNQAGANLITGLTATILAASPFFGPLHAEIGLFETDEAALPQAILETKPRLVVIHNLFRDQLDRYGEVDTLAKHWKKALMLLPATSHVILNADDPAVAYLGEGLTAQVTYYGVDDSRHATNSTDHIADSQFCRCCGQHYTYSLTFYSHIGHYHCPNCGHSRPTPQVKLTRLDLRGTASSQLLITYPEGTLEIELPLPGLYNAVNALAAATVGFVLGAKPALIQEILAAFKAAFGRIERIQTPEGQPILIALIKNPVGASETIRMLTSGITEKQQKIALLLIINDKIADGTDVSWLWDAAFEPLTAYLAEVIVSGTRAEDMAVRLKYAGVASEQIKVEPEIAKAVAKALKMTPAGETLAILPTYTAMLELRAELAERGWVQPFWEDGL